MKPRYHTNLRSIRTSQNLTRMGLAAAADTNMLTLQQIENYGYVPGPVIRQRIAAALGVTEAEIWPAQTQEATQ